MILGIGASQVVYIKLFRIWSKRVPPCRLRFCLEDDVCLFQNSPFSEKVLVIFFAGMSYPRDPITLSDDDWGV